MLFLKYHFQFGRTFSLLTKCFKATKIANRGYKLSKILQTKERKNNVIFHVLLQQAHLNK